MPQIEQYDPFAFTASPVTAQPHKRYDPFSFSPQAGELDLQPVPAHVPKPVVPFSQPSAERFPTRESAETFLSDAIARGKARGLSQTEAESGAGEQIASLEGQPVELPTARTQRGSRFSSVGEALKSILPSAEPSVQPKPPVPTFGKGILPQPQVKAFPGMVAHRPMTDSEQHALNFMKTGLIPPAAITKFITMTPLAVHAGHVFRPEGFTPQELEKFIDDPTIPKTQLEAFIAGSAIDAGKQLSAFTSPEQIGLMVAGGAVAKVFTAANEARVAADAALRDLSALHAAGISEGPELVAAWQKARSAIQAYKAAYNTAQVARVASGATGAGFGVQGAKNYAHAKTLSEKLDALAQVLLGVAGFAGSAKAFPLPTGEELVEPYRRRAAEKYVAPEEQPAPRVPVAGLLSAPEPPVEPITPSVTPQAIPQPAPQDIPAGPVSQGIQGISVETPPEALTPPTAAAPEPVSEPAKPIARPEPERPVEATPEGKLITDKRPTPERREQTGPYLVGHGSELITASGRHYTHYKVVEADNLLPSHNAQSFQPETDYPPLVQERTYDLSKEAQARVIQQAQNYDPNFTVNTNPDAVNGPAIVTPDGIVLGGNGRVMSTQRLYAAGRGDLYKNRLIEQADVFGLDPSQVARFKQPILVRALDRGPGSNEEARRLAQDLNRTFTGALGINERAVSAGRSITPNTFLSLGQMMEKLGPDTTIRDVLRERPREIISALESDRVITERERPQFIDSKTGGLSEYGKDFVERALLGSVIDDVELLDSSPKASLNRVEGSLADLSKLKAREDQWDITPILRESLRESAKIQASGQSVDDYLSQRSLFGRPRDQAVDSIVRMLTDKTAGSKQRLKASIHQFSQDSTADVYRQPTLGLTTPADAVESFNAAFGTKLTQAQYADSIQRISDQEAKRPLGQVETKPSKSQSSRAEKLSEPLRAGPRGKTAASKKEVSKSDLEQLISSLSKKQVAGMPFGVAASAAPGPSTAPSPGIIRASEIAKRLQKFLNVPVGFGRFKQRAWGIFKVGPKAIRLRSTANYSVLLHELAHSLNKYLWGNIENLRDSQFLKYRNELMGFVQSFPKSQRNLTEGYAEFTRIWLENRAEAERQAPNFTSFFEGLLNQPQNDELRDVMLETQRMVSAYEAQESVDKLLGSIHYDEKRHKTWRERWTALSKGVYDHLDPIRLQQNLVYGTKWADQVNPDVNAFAMASRLNVHVRGEFTAHELQGVRDYETRQLVPGTKGALEVYTDLFSGVKDPEQEYRRFGAYMISLSAIERMKANPKSVQALELQEFEKAKTTLGTEHPKFQAAAAQLHEDNARLLDQLQKSGVASPEVITKIKELHQNHVPLYRHIDPNGLARAGAGIGKGVARVGLPFQRAKGGRQDYLDPIVSRELNAAAIIATIERARVNTALYKWSKVPDAASVIEEVSPKTHPVSFRLDEVKNALEGAGYDPEQGELEAVAQVWRPVHDRDPKFAQHYDRKDDKLHILEIKDPDMVKAIGSLRPTEIGPFVQALAIFSRGLHLGVSSSPLFALRHGQRHGLYALNVSNYLDPFNYAAGIARGVVDMFRGGSDIKEAMVRQGLSFASIPGLGRQRIEDFVKGELKKKEKGLPYSLVARNPLEVMSRLTGALDMLTREPEYRAAYKNALERGATAAESEIFAGYQAAEVSVNFAKIGEWMAELSRMAPFARAHEIGQIKLAQAFARRPLTTTRNFLMTITALSILLYLLNRKDKRYHQLPAWRKIFFWNIPVPKGFEKFTGWHWIMYPKPWVAGWSFGSVPEAIMERLDGHTRSFSHVVENFLPTQVPDFVPLAGQVVVHQLENKTKFGSPIVPTGMEKVKPEYQVGPYTPALARWIGHALGTSPARIAAAWRDLTGNTGNDLSKISDLIDRLAGVGGPAPPSRKLAGAPFISGLGAPPPGFDAQPIQDFYKVKDQLDRQYGTARIPFRGVKDLSNMNPKELAHAEAIIQREPGLTKEIRVALDHHDVYSAFSETAKLIKAARDQAQEVRESKTLTPDVKQEEIHKWADAAIGVAESALEAYDAFERRQKAKPLHPSVFRPAKREEQVPASQ